LQELYNMTKFFFATFLALAILTCGTTAIAQTTQTSADTATAVALPEPPSIDFLVKDGIIAAEATAAINAFSDYEKVLTAATKNAEALKRYTQCQASPSGDDEADQLCNDRYWRVIFRDIRLSSLLHSSRQTTEEAVEKLEKAKKVWHEEEQRDLGDEKEDALALFLIRTKRWLNDQSVERIIDNARKAADKWFNDKYMTTAKNDSEKKE
jgi:predicted RNase H-like HicB family nuclease